VSYCKCSKFGPDRKREFSRSDATSQDASQPYTSQHSPETVTNHSNQAQCAMRPRRFRRRADVLCRRNGLASRRNRAW